MKSIFTDKGAVPVIQDLKHALGETFPMWERFEDYTKKNSPQATSEWNFSGEKYGWSYRIKDKKRVIIYLLPRDNFFKAAFVFGQKAVDQILESDIAESIKTELKQARPYAEGRGIRIDVKDQTPVEDILKLIKIKISG